MPLAAPFDKLRASRAESRDVDGGSPGNSSRTRCSDDPGRQLSGGFNVGQSRHAPPVVIRSARIAQTEVVVHLRRAEFPVCRSGNPPTLQQSASPLRPAIARVQSVLRVSRAQAPRRHRLVGLSVSESESGDLRSAIGDLQRRSGGDAVTRCVKVRRHRHVVLDASDF